MKKCRTLEVNKGETAVRLTAVIYGEGAEIGGDEDEEK
jgi:hypothetical protein